MWQEANNLNSHMPVIIAGVGWVELETKEEYTYNHWHKSKFDYVFGKGAIELKEGCVAFGEGSVAPNESQGSDHFPIYFNP